MSAETNHYLGKPSYILTVETQNIQKPRPRPLHLHHHLQPEDQIISAPLPSVRKANTRDITRLRPAERNPFCKSITLRSILIWRVSLLLLSSAVLVLRPVVLTWSALDHNANQSSFTSSPFTYCRLCFAVYSWTTLGFCPQSRPILERDQQVKWRVNIRELS